MSAWRATVLAMTDDQVTGWFESGRYAVSLDALAHLAAESDRFAQVLRATPAHADVPTCPEWDAADLLWHLGGVQAFWATVVERGLTNGEDVEALPDPQRPADTEGLLRFFDDASARLRAALAAGSEEEPRWTWAPDHTVGFIRRRQAHEALIHRIDAEVVAGTRTPIDSTLAVDGVDETLQVMYGGEPTWGGFTPDDGAAVLVRATDSEHEWVAALGRFTGTDPDGDDVDEDDIRVSRGGGPAKAQVEGSAADLDCWLWHRPTTGQVQTSGDQQVLDRFLAIVSQAIN